MFISIDKLFYHAVLAILNLTFSWLQIYPTFFCNLNKNLKQVQYATAD